MNKAFGILAGALAALSMAGAAQAAQTSGQVGSGAPEDVFMTLTLDANDALTISQTEIHLALGGYYRFNLECPASGPKNEASIAFSAPDLWENSHMRIVSVSEPASGFKVVGEINFHVQGLQIRMVECEGLPKDARFSFYPMKKGTYGFTVLNSTVDPGQTIEGKFIVE